MDALKAAVPFNTHLLLYKLCILYAPLIFLVKNSFSGVAAFYYL